MALQPTYITDIFRSLTLHAPPLQPAPAACHSSLAARRALPFSWRAPWPRPSAAISLYVYANPPASPQGPLLSLPAAAAGESSLYQFTVQRNGQPFALSAFAGKVVVVMNIASE